ncbi:hypothetical protein [Halanaeroarchaeum sp. HSR-CO]|uniref:hypothetical protein n=1 Tax=Halanaeroarchaeum sp. HSR-CO TaxID=2866382 RepID=UPI00217DD798|nr:hypothetical protein [Halanaeroarchaeum sp. HSR-CO]
MTEDDGPVDGASQSADPSADSGGGLPVSRRTLIAGIAGIGVGTAVGVGYGLMGDSADGREIAPTEPNDDGEATLAEFHYILEESGPEEGRLDVTRFRFFDEEDVIAVNYRTRAKEVEDVPPQRQHVREVGQMIRMFSEYVAQNGERGSVVHARIDNPSEAAKQPDGYLVQREWIRQYNAEEFSGAEIVNKVLASGYFDEALEDAMDNGTTFSDSDGE